MRTIAVGDIHGCRASLEALAEYAGFGRGDTIVTLGDYVDRGPDTRGVIDFLLALGEEVKLVPLVGNHEVIMMEARDSPGSLLSWMDPRVGGAATLDSYDAQDFGAIPAEHWKFISEAGMYYEMETHFFVHANAVAHLPLEEQSTMVLLWERFDHPLPHQSGKIMVCGHTSQKSGMPVNLGHAICIDTWACGDGWLTALDVQSGLYWQTNEKGERRSEDIASLLSIAKEETNPPPRGE